LDLGHPVNLNMGEPAPAQIISLIGNQVTAGQKLVTIANYLTKMARQSKAAAIGKRGKVYTDRWLQPSRTVGWQISQISQ
jgi:hypothetical protein